MAHPVTDALASVTDPTQRQAIKVAAFMALPSVPMLVSVRGYVVMIVGNKVSVDATGCLDFHIKVTKAGKDVTPDDGHIRVWGMDVIVPDSAGDIVVQTYNNPIAKVPVTLTFREDVKAA